MGAYQIPLGGAPMKTLCHQWEVAKKDGRGAELGVAGCLWNSACF